MRKRSFLLSFALLVPALAAGCGGDSGNDESFVRDLCEASSQLTADLDTALKSASSQTDAGKAVEAFVAPLERYVDSFKDADPPKDLEAWHKSASDQLAGVVANFKETKTLSALEGFSDSPVPDPPAEAKQRLRAAAAEVEECNGVTFLKPD